MATPTITARLSALYQQQLGQGATDKTTALRAYLLLGFAGSGVDMRPFQREIQRLLAEDLAPEVERALRGVLDGSDQPAALELLIPQPALEDAPAEDGGDPLLSVGMDF